MIRSSAALPSPKRKFTVPQLRAWRRMAAAFRKKMLLAGGNDNTAPIHSATRLANFWRYACATRRHAHKESTLLARCRVQRGRVPASRAGRQCRWSTNAVRAFTKAGALGLTDGGATEPARYRSSVATACAGIANGARWTVSTVPPFTAAHGGNRPAPAQPAPGAKALTSRQNTARSSCDSRLSVGSLYAWRAELSRHDQPGGTM